MERIAYGLDARCYEIDVEEKDAKVARLSRELKGEQGLRKRFSRRYRILSSRTDLSGKEHCDLFNMLTQVEVSFRSLKHDLSLRSVYHRVSRRIQGHLFVTVLAYLLLWVIQRKPHERGIRHHLTTMQTHLSGQVRVTTSMVNDRGQVIHRPHFGAGSASPGHGQGSRTDGSAMAKANHYQVKNL